MERCWNLAAKREPSSAAEPQDFSRPIHNRVDSLPPHPAAIEKSAPLYAQPVAQRERRPESCSTGKPAEKSLSRHNGRRAHLAGADVMLDAVESEQYLTQHDQGRRQANSGKSNALQQIGGIDRFGQARERQLLDKTIHAVADDPQLPRAQPPSAVAERLNLGADANWIPQGRHEEEDSETPALLAAHPLGERPVENYQLIRAPVVQQIAGMRIGMKQG